MKDALAHTESLEPDLTARFHFAVFSFFMDISRIPQAMVWGRKTRNVPTAMATIPQKTTKSKGKLSRVLIMAGFGA
jgi:hypothetical protein